MKRRTKEKSAILRTAGERPPFWAAAVVLAFFIGIVYLPSVRVPLIFDDIPCIVQNDSITSLWPIVGFGKPGPLNPPPEYPTSGRPLVNLALAVVYHFGGPSPTGYHVLSVVLHFFNAMLLWAITRRTLSLPYFRGRFGRLSGWLALAVAILWALHPLQTESVIYATQSTELMMAFFYLATLYCSLRYWEYGGTALEGGGVQQTLLDHDQSRRRNRWLVLAVFACLCGMASKEVMVSAPLIVLLFDRVFVSGSLRNALSRFRLLYVGLSLTWILLVALVLTLPRSDSAGFHVGVPAHEWWFTQSKVFFMYLKLVVWPWPLLIHYELPYLTTFAEAWPYVVPLFLLGVATLVLLVRNRPLGFLGSWYFAILAPTFVIPIFTEMAAERRMYLALAPLLAVIVVGAFLLVLMFSSQEARPPAAQEYRTRLTVLGVPTLVLALVFCFVGTSRLTAYEDEMNLWVEVMHAQPENSRAHLYVGTYLEKRGDEDGAMAQYREAIRIVPLAAQAHYQLAMLLNKRGDHEQAAQHFALSALSLPKRNPTMHNDMAVALYMAGHNDEAIKAFRTTLEIDSNFWPAYRNLGTALQKASKFDEAAESFKTALRLNPQGIDIYNDLANSYFRLNERAQAIAALEQGLELAKAANDVEHVKKYTAALQAKR